MKTRRRGITPRGDSKGLIGLRTPEATAVKSGEHEFGRMVGEEEKEKENENKREYVAFL